MGRLRRRPGRHDPGHGITGRDAGGLGAAAIPNFIFWTLTGWLLCMFIGELATMLPDRTGGAPAYAYYAFKDRLPKAYAAHQRR